MIIEIFKVKVDSLGGHEITGCSRNSIHTGFYGLVKIEEMQKLESKDAQIKILREALEFYADKNNCNNTESCFVYEIDPYSGDEIADEGYTTRQALAEIDKMKGV